MKEIIMNYLPDFLILVGGAGVTWFFSRNFKKVELKKAKQELENSKTTSIENNLALYQKMIDDIDARYSKRIDGLVLEISDIRRKYKELENEFDEYKEKHP